MDVDTTPKKKTVYCQALQHVIEYYLPKLRVTEENKDATPTIHLKVPQILCILQENDLINMCMQDPSSARMLDVLFKRLWELVHTREMESMWAGFVLLDEVFKYCNHEKLMAHFETWMKDFQDAISLKKKMDKGTALPRGLGAWCTLAARASEWADLKRACSVHVPFITVALLAPLATESEYSNETKIACIEHLCTLLDSMNSSVKPQVPKIEAACLPFLFHHNFELRNAASQLFGFLPKCFSSSSMHLTPFIDKTIEHSHLFLDVIFAGLEDKSRAKSTTNHAQLPPIAGMKAENLLDGFKGICSCLSTLFSTKFNYPSELPLENVLKLITRIFYVNYGMTNAGTATSEPDQLSPAERLALIPFVHITALELLDTLVVNLQRHLLAHTRSILRIITQIHTRTLTRITSAQKLAYIVLGHTVELVCGAGLWGICEDALLAKLLSDTSPPHKVAQKSILDVKLAGKSRHNNNAGGKKKKKKNGIDSGADDYEGDSDVTMEVKYKALKALYSILLHTGSHVPPQQRTKIDRTIVAHLLKVTSDRSTQYDSAYKVALFRCLKAAVLRPVPSCPPILVFSLRLFNFGLVDKCSKVVRICKEGAAICENQVHPYVPTLPSNYLPPVPLPQSSSIPSIPTPATPITPVSPSPAVSEIANTPTPSTTSRKRKEPETVIEEEEEQEDKIEVADKSMVDADEEESEEVKESQEVLPSGSNNKVVVESSDEDEVVINYTKTQQTVVTTESHGTISQVETISSTSFAITDDGDDDDDLDIAIDDAPPDSDEDVSDLE